VIPTGKPRALVRENSVTVPAGVMRPILPAFASVNQRLPSAPAAMSVGPPPPVRIGNVVRMPVTVIRPMLLL